MFQSLYSVHALWKTAEYWPRKKSLKYPTILAIFSVCTNKINLEKKPKFFFHNFRNSTFCKGFERTASTIIRF